jgi:Flp pilus assembly protein TadD
MRPFLLLAALLSAAATAADFGSAPAPQDPLAEARSALAAKDWKGAERELRRVIAKEPRNADAHNLLGYSLRWQERYEEALAAYGRVFEIDPKHLGAHEYIGRAYLKMGRRPEAERHLAQLRTLCGDCTEARDLAKALAEPK